jgi:hypothetical protein
MSSLEQDANGSEREMDFMELRRWKYQRDKELERLEQRLERERVEREN